MEVYFVRKIIFFIKWGNISIFKEPRNPTAALLFWKSLIIAIILSLLVGLKEKVELILKCFFFLQSSGEF